MSQVVADVTRLDPTAKQKVSYAVPIWLRDEQIAQNITITPRRLEPATDLRTDPIAVVCFGPSLNETWEQIRTFKYVISCSGAHKFLVERGIMPTWHVDVDPRVHKMALIGEPQASVEYLLASTCHPVYVRTLTERGFNLKLWHVFDQEDEAIRVLPPGEWALTGGCSVGLRALAIARFLGFTHLDVFGMDGNEGATGKHADAHPNQAQMYNEVDFGGRVWRTTPGFLEAARQTAHELDDLPDVTARFHGDGLVQSMMRDYVRTPHAKGKEIAYNRPPLISNEYRALNAQLHRDNLAYGVGAGKHADVVKKLVKTLRVEDGIPPSVLDYGAGKRYLQKALPFPIYEYDPAIPAIAESPRPADLVCCLDVLEHIEPDKLFWVLGDLRRCVKQIGYFVINTGPAKKSLPDGRNTHLIQQGQAWWTEKLSQFFTVPKMVEKGSELHAIVAPLSKPKKAHLQGTTLQPSTPAPRLDFDRLTFRREPYVIGCASGVLPVDLYRDLCATFPPIELFKSFGEYNRKWSLSTVNNPDHYASFLAQHEIWRAFHRYVKHDLLAQMSGLLKAHGVDWRSGSNLRTRWEFSLLPADGGCLRPHTDIVSKLVTIVVSMRPLGDTEWNQEWGGGTDVLAVKADAPPMQDYKADWTEFDVVDTYQYVPNQAVVFIKGDNSWHSVGPMTGPANVLRRSLTINIEKAV